MDQGFIPISPEEFIPMHMRSNPGSNRKDIEEGLEKTIAAAKNGKRCDCGQPIWIIGSIFVGYSCFTCITGETNRSEDYEIAVEGL
jgi:hypothetical protein